MAKSVITNQKELVNKLSKIIKAYDIYTAYIDDYRKYSNAIERNRELDQEFIHTCKKYGYDVQTSFCYLLAESFVSGRFDSAEDAVIDYINSLEEENMKSNTDTVKTNNSTMEVNEETRRARDIDFYAYLNEKFEIIDIDYELLTEIINDELDLTVRHIPKEELAHDTEIRTQYAIIASKIAATKINTNNNMAFRVLSEDKSFWCDCIINNDNIMEVRVAYTLENDNPIIENEYGCIINFEKEKSIMNNSTSVETNNSATVKVEKEETTMKYNWKNINGAFITEVTMEGFEHLNLTAIIIGTLENPSSIKIIGNYKSEHEWLVCFADMNEYMNFGNLVPDTHSQNVYIGHLLTQKEESTMKNNTNTTATNNSATTLKEEIIMMEELVKRITENRKVQDKDYIDRATLKTIMNEQFGFNFNNRSTRTEMVEVLMAMYKDSLDIADEIAYGNIDTEDSVSVGDLEITHDNAPESIESDPTPVVENPVPVSDAKAKTIEVLKLIKDAAVTNHNKGFGTTVSAYMLCAYILQAGYGIKKLKGHEAEITDEQKDTVKRVRQWLIDKGYIKACVYKTNGKSVYTDDYDGNHAASMIHYSKSQGLTCVGVSSYKITF